MIFSSTPVTGSARDKGPGRYLAAGVGYGRAHGPNRILLRIRRDNERAASIPGGVSLISRVDAWLLSIEALRMFGGYTSWDSVDHPRYVLTVASPEEVEHAERVLLLLQEVVAQANRGSEG